MRLTIKAVNKAIAERGGKAKLHQGEGYLYFYDGEADYFNQQSVPVCRLNQAELSFWISEWEDRVKEASILEDVPEHAKLRAYITNPERLTLEVVRERFMHFWHDLKSDALKEDYGVNRAAEWERFVGHHVEENRLPESARQWKCPRSL